MEERLRIGEATFQVSAKAEGDVLRLGVGGETIEVALVSSGEGRHVVSVGGRTETLYTAVTAEGTWVWHRGRARLVTREAPPTRLPRHLVTPPTPAVVVALLVGPGQEVAKGQALAVVSAMKMETQLCAPFATRVKAVPVAVGAKVRPGEVLIELEPEVK